MRRLGESDIITDGLRVRTLTLPLEGYSGIGVDHAAMTLNANIEDVLSLSGQEIGADAALVRGDVIVVDATPKPTRMAVGAANTVFFSDGTDPAWVAANANVPVAPAAQGDILIADGTPVWSVLSIGAQYTHLESNGTTATWEANITLADDATIGLSGGGNWQFDGTPAPDQVILNSADLNLNGGDIYVPDNTADALTLYDGGPLNYLRIISTDAQPAVVFNEGGADVDFRVEGSGAANALFVRGSDGHAGFGTNAPGTTVHLYTATSQDGLKIDRDGTATELKLYWATGGNNRWNWGLEDDGTDNLWLYGYGAAAFVQFWEYATGDVGIGTVSPAAQLHVDQASATGAQPVLLLDQGDVSEQCIQFSSDGADRDINLFTVDVTGAPTMLWDESEDELRWNFNFRLYDGAGDSPALRFTTEIAGDTFAVFAEDDIAPGSSDFIIRLVDAAGTSRLKIQDNSPATVLEIDSDGNVVVVDDATIGLSGGGGWQFDATPAPDQIILNSADLNMNGNDIYVPDNTADALTIYDAGTINYLRIISTNTQPVVAWNEDGADVDFRIEGVGVADAFFVQGSDGFVGIGKTPTVELDVDGRGHFTSTSSAVYGLSSGAGTTGILGRNNNNTGVGVFGDSTGTDAVGAWGSIGVGGTANSIAVYATQNGTGAALVADLIGAGTAIFDARDNGTTAFIVDDGGKVGVGALAAPSRLLHMYHATADIYLRIETDKANGVAGIELFNDARQWGISCNSSDQLQFRDGTAPGNRLFIDTNGHVYPGSSKTVDCGIVGNEWDDVRCVTLTEGTSRLINSAMVCPVCQEPMKKGTGGTVVIGEVADYEFVFCVNCGNVAVETRDKQTPEMLAEREPPPKIELTGIRTKCQGGHDYKVMVDFVFVDPVTDDDGNLKVDAEGNVIEPGVFNSTRLGDDELAAFLALATDEERKAFLLTLGRREWYAREEARVMAAHVAALRGQHETLVEGLVGVDLLQ